MKTLISKYITLLLSFLLIGTAIIIFLYTLNIRKPWFGTLSNYHHQWLTGSTVEYAYNWYKEGPFNLKFALLQDPKSVESVTFNSRSPYFSYPSGTVLPIYIISKILNRTPSPSMVMAYNLSNHLLITLLLSFSTFVILLRLKLNVTVTFLFALIPIFLELLLPGTLYWHQNVFWADQAVILPFVFLIFLEIIKNKPLIGRPLLIINILEYLTIFYGIFTDWLFIPVVFTVVILRTIVLKKKNIKNIIRNTSVYITSAILSLGLFAWQIYYFHAFNTLKDTFLFRSASNEIGEVYIKNFPLRFVQEIGYAYGLGGDILILLSALIFIISLVFLITHKHHIKKDINNGLSQLLLYISLVAFPCIIQVLILRNHTYIHDFSVLKFSLVIALIPLVLIPVLLWQWSQNIKYFKKYSLRTQVILLCISLLGCGLYLKNTFPEYKKLFYPPDKIIEERGEFIFNNTSFYDVVFSPDFEIPTTPPQAIAYSEKRVYEIYTLGDIYNIVKNINDDYIVNFVLINEDKANLNKFHNLIITGDIKISNGTYTIYKIKKTKFLALLSSGL